MGKRADDLRQAIFASLLICIAIGVPIWWKTTEIHRASLPAEISAFLNPNQEGNQNKINQLLNQQWHLSVDLVFIGSSETTKQIDMKQLSELSKDRVNSETKKLDASNKFIITSQNFHKITEEVASKLSKSNDEIDEWINQEPQFKEVISRTKNGRYAFFIFLSNSASDEEVIMGKYRTGFIRIQVPTQSSQEFISSSNLPTKLTNAIKNYILGPSLQKETYYHVREATQYRISVSLLNSNPFDFIPVWNFEEDLNVYLQPFIDRISRVADFTYDSQVIQFATLSKAPLYDKQQKKYYLASNSLPTFINPTEWKLDLTDSTTQPLLNFIVFIPGRNETPLHIVSSVTPSIVYSATDSFTIPQWGGVIIFNPSLDNSTKQTNQIYFSKQNTQRIMQLFIGQLRELLGIHQSEGSKCWDNVHGLSVWEVDILTRRHLISHVKTTISTLSSLYSLVYNLTNMVVKDNIGDLCRDSIDSLHKTLSSIISDSDYDNAIKYARISLDKAEQAFFDPNMLSLLYFPEEHKYAIYALPFFPIAVQVFKAIYEEIKVRRQKSLQPKPKPKLE